MSPLRLFQQGVDNRKPEGRASFEDNSAHAATINGVVFELATTHREEEYQVEQVSQRNGRWKASLSSKLGKSRREEDTALNRVIREREAAEKVYKKQVRELDFLGAYLFKKKGPIVKHPQYQKKLEYVIKEKERVRVLVEEEKALKNGFVL